MNITLNESTTLNPILAKTAKSIRRTAYELSKKYLDGKMKTISSEAIMLGCAMGAARPKPGQWPELRCANIACRHSGPGPTVLGDTLSYECSQCGGTWRIDGMSDAKFLSSLVHMDEKELRDNTAKCAKMRKRADPQPRPRICVSELDITEDANDLKVIYTMAPAAYMTLVRHGMEVHDDHAVIRIQKPDAAKRLLREFHQALSPEQLLWPYIREFISRISSSAKAMPNTDRNSAMKWVL